MTHAPHGWPHWNGRSPLVRFGQDVVPTPPAPAPDGQPGGFTLDDFKAGVKAVTPTLLIVGIATGAAFAIGSVLVSRYVFPKR